MFSASSALTSIDMKYLFQNGRARLCRAVNNLFRVRQSLTLPGIYLVSALSASALGGVGRFQNCYEVVPAGTFIPATAFASNWITENGATASFPNSTSATFTGRGNSSDVTTYSNWLTMSENWVMTWTQTIPTINTTSYGIGGGVRSVFNTTLLSAANQRSYYAQVGDTTAANGNLYIFEWANGTGTQRAVAGTALSLQAGDKVTVTFGRETNMFYAWAVDSRTSASNYVSFQFPLSDVGSAPLPGDNLVSHFGFWIVGGTITVTNFSVSSTLNTPLFCLVTGASRDVGFDATNNAARWQGVVQSNCFYPIRTCAASSALGSNFLNCEPEYAFLHPLNIVMPDIGNNVIFNVLTYTNDFNSLAAWATQTNGSMIIVHPPTPHNATDESTCYAFITNYYPACIDVWKPLVTNSFHLQTGYAGGVSELSPLGLYVMGTNMLAAFCNPPYTTYAFPPQ
jgi:hypothetical protein